jgi:NDP-sugar pyrophosphorylase family protein
VASFSHALLLTAGLGTRLRPLTLVRAKPAIPVGGVPMVHRIIRWLADAGVRDVVLNLHHLPHTIAGLVGDGGGLGVRARYSWESPVVLGSAGGPRQALEIIGAGTFLIINGDTLTDVPLAPLAAAHASNGALVTMAVVPNAQPEHYSGLRVAADGAVVGVEPRGSRRPSFHFIGVQAADARAFADLPRGRVANSVGEVYDALIASRPGSIRAHLCDARFWDIGTVADYWHSSRAFASAAAGPGTPGAVVGSGAQLIDSIAWDDVVLGPRSTVTRCIVTDGVRVPAGAVYSDAILMQAADGSIAAMPLIVEPR